MMVLCYLLFVIFQTINFFYTVKNPIGIDTIPIGIETILVFIFIFYFLYEFFISTNTDYVYNHHCFWIAIGALVYLGTSFFIYILANNISKEIHDNVWYITYISEIIKNILFSVAIVVYAKNNKLKSNKKNIPYLDF
jgi:hypothetical protein